MKAAWTSLLRAQNVETEPCAADPPTISSQKKPHHRSDARMDLPYDPLIDAYAGSHHNLTCPS